MDTLNLVRKNHGHVGGHISGNYSFSPQVCAPAHLTNHITHTSHLTTNNINHHTKLAMQQPHTNTGKGAGWGALKNTKPTKERGGSGKKAKPPE